MHPLSASQLSRRLSDRIESVCKELLPNGTRRYGRWEAGSVRGESGSSLKVELGGEKKGIWADFATNESGDLLDLWVQVRRLSVGAAMKEAATFLGIRLDGEASAPHKEYRTPAKPRCQSISNDHPMMQWLKGRGFTEETINKYRLAVNSEGELVMPYIKHGKFLNAKYRKLPKSFRQESGAQPSLFGWNVIEECFPASRSVTVVEGELDCMSLNQLGFPSLSVPMGGGGGRKQDWIESDFDELAQFDTIYIATDMDEAGDRAADEITKRLGAERCRRVTLPFKDANECLMRGVPVEDIQAALRSAKSNDPVELKRAGHFTDEVLELFAGGGTLGSVGVRTPWGKDEFRLRPGELTIVAGYSGSGKSTLLSQMAIDGMMQGSRWCIASMEMPARATIGGMVQAITQTPTPDTNLIKLVVNWLDSRLWVFDVRGSAQTDRLLTVFDYAARRYSISHFVVDSLAKCGMAEDDYNGQKKFVEQLTDLNHAHGCNTSLVAHSRKGESESVRPRKHDVRGATAITDMADNVMTVWRNKSDEHENKAELIFDKQRLTGWEGTIHLNYDPICKQFLYGDDGPKDYLRLIQ